jgi:hypothetical protein
MAFIVPATSPRKVVLVRNTFIEVDDGESEHMELDNSKPVYRRRRGSSFFRSSSAPLTAGRSHKTVADSDEFTDLASTQDFGSDSERTHMTSCIDDNASSRSQSPSPERHFVQVPMLNSQTSMRRAPQPPPPGNFQQIPHESVLTAAMDAGFRAGVMAAAFRTMHLGMPPTTSAPMVPWTQLPKFAEPPQQVHIASNDVGEDDAEGFVHKQCHLVWCDHRAFKESSAPMKEQLQNATGLSVKTHRTAENCLRLLRKKRNASGRPPCVFLSSLANAPALLGYLNEAGHMRAKVIVLAESRRHEAGNALLQQYPMVTEVAKTWQEAVQAACRAMASV